MRALLAALALVAAPGWALGPGFEDANGDGVPDTLAWHPEPLAVCAPAACAGAGAGLDAQPGAEGSPQLVGHAGFAEARAGDCAVACAAARLDTFYAQEPGRQPDITLHGVPDFGATGAASARARDARLDLPFEAVDTDHNNNTRLGVAAPHGVGPVEGEAGAESAVLVLLHHDRGLPHTRLAYVAPYAEECAYAAACAALDLNHSYFHHDGDDDVVHEQHRAGFDDTLGAGLDGCLVACPPGVVHAEGDAGFLLEDSFFVQEPPSGVRGDFAAAALVQPPLLATPPLAEAARGDFAVRDPDRDLAVDEAYAEACGLGQCVHLGR